MIQSSKRRMLLALFAVTTVILVEPCAAQSFRSTDEIIKQLKSLTLPELGQGPDKRYTTENIALARQHADLAKQMWTLDPDHPATATYVRLRWDVMLSVPLAFGDWQGPLGNELFHVLHDDPASEASRSMLELMDKCAKQVDLAVTEECEHALKLGADNPIAQQAYYPIARYYVGRLLDGDRQSLDKAMSAIDTLMEFGAESDRNGFMAPRLLAWTADYGFESFGDERRIALLERLQRDFPDSNEAASAGGKLRLARAIGEPFSLEFKDAIDGESVSLQDFRGSIVVLDVWATWCAPCLAAMPRLKKIQTEVGEDRLTVIGISIDEPAQRKQMIQLVKKQDYGWPQLHDPESETPFADQYGVTRIPFYFLIDKDGVLRSAGNDIEPQLRELLDRD